MDMQSIIKKSVGKEVIHKLTGEVATISGVEDGRSFIVYVDAQPFSFIEFVTNYNLEFKL